MYVLATSSIARNKNRKNRIARSSGRKLSVVRTATPPMSSPTQTLEYLNRGQLLTYPSSQAIAWFPAPATTITSDVRDFTLESLTVPVGDVIAWTNRGDTAHTVTSGTSPSPDGTWDSGSFNSGQSFSFAFENAGEFAYFCSIHPFMTGTITVVEKSVGAALDRSASSGDAYAPGGY